MAPEKDTYVLDQFTDQVRYASIAAAFVLGLIFIPFLWPMAIVSFATGIACIFLRYRVTFDFATRIFRDERGFKTPRSSEETSFDEFSVVEVGYADVQGQYGIHRNYFASVKYTEAAREPHVLITNFSLEKVSQLANELSRRIGIPLRITPDLQKMKAELDGLAESATPTGGDKYGGEEGL